MSYTTSVEASHDITRPSIPNLQVCHRTKWKHCRYFLCTQLWRLIAMMTALKKRWKINLIIAYHGQRSSSGFFEWDSDLFKLMTVLCIVIAQKIGPAGTWFVAMPAMSIEPLHVTSSPIDNSLLHSKIVSQYKCMPHSSHSHNSSRIPAQMGASPLGLYYASLWRNAKVALQSKRSMPCGGIAKVMSSLDYVVRMPFPVLFSESGWEENSIL